MILVTGRGTAQKFDPPEGERWVAISITDPSLPPAELSDKFEQILRLSFDDIDPQHGTVMYGTWAEGQPMTSEDAKKIVAFTTGLGCSNGEGEANVLVHCEMGISRSNAVGRWLLADHACLGPIKFTSFPDEDDPQEKGNPHVTRMLEYTEEAQLYEHGRNMEQVLRMIFSDDDDDDA